jgi:DNA-binding response OmpR family regulator
MPISRKRGAPALSQTPSRGDSSLDVLIIDDDPLVTARLELLIESCGHGALGVASVDEARQAMIAVYFPVVIMDRMLGSADGIDLCREYRARHPESPVYIMMLSSLDSPADIEAGIRAGADDYVSKRASDAIFLERFAVAASVMNLAPKSKQS